MKFSPIIFTYTGKIAKNYGVDGVYDAVKGDVFTPDNIKSEGIAKVWVSEGFAEYKTGKDIKPKEELKYEDVPKQELDNEFKDELIDKEIKEKINPPKKRGRPSKK